MPAMPKQYSNELVQLIKTMLHQDPGKRPSVNKLLRDPYIKENIAIFLEETKQKYEVFGIKVLYLVYLPINDICLGSIDFFSITAQFDRILYYSFLLKHYNGKINQNKS